MPSGMSDPDRNPTPADEGPDQREPMIAPADVPSAGELLIGLIDGTV